MNPLEQSKSTGEQFYLAELPATRGCSQEKTTGLVYDPLFQASGLFTTVYDVQDENNVLEILEGSRDYNTTNTELKKDYKISGWNRPTLSWNISCENQGYSR